MQKFVQRSCVEIDHNKHNRSTPLVAKLMFWGVRNDSLLHELRCKMGQTGGSSAQVRATKLSWNFRQRKHPIHPIEPQTHVLGRFKLFRYCTNLGAKSELEHLMHKFMQRSRVGNFRNERTQAIPLDPKLMFRGVLEHFVMHELRWKMGRAVAINAQVHGTKLRRNFSQRTHRIHPIGPQTLVFGCFRLFRYCMNLVQNGPNRSN
jgi:hypothetical protein